MIKATSVFCSICNQTFHNFSKKKLFYHQKYHEYVFHKCQECDFTIDNSCLLEFHIRKNHLKTKLWNLQELQLYWIRKQNEKICFSKEDAKEILQILLNYVYFKLYVLIYLFLLYMFIYNFLIFICASVSYIDDY